MDAKHSELNVTICSDARDAVMRGFDYAAGEEYRPIWVENVVIVQNGTVSGKSTVDFVLVNENGENYVFMLTGALLKMAANIAK